MIRQQSLYNHVRIFSARNTNDTIILSCFTMFYNVFCEPRLTLAKINALFFFCIDTGLANTILFKKSRFSAQNEATFLTSSNRDSRHYISPGLFFSSKNHVQSSLGKIGSL